jgi:Xaa-Pro aminopeptidase
VNEGRIDAARVGMSGRGVDALVLTIGSDLPYLTGYRAMENERITAFVLPASGDPVLVVPVLEEPRVESVVETRSWGETEDPLAIIAGLVGPATTIAIGDQTWSRFLLGLQERLPDVTFVAAEPILAPLRMVKDESEIAALRAAGAATDRVVARLAETELSGMTERRLARLVDELTLDEGHERTAHAIVAAGPNSASPHHEPTDRVVEAGDSVVVDFGGWLDGYGSDTTRTFVVGEPPDGFDEAYEVLAVAQRSAVDAVKPGASAESIDAVARGIITDAGYGDRFIHRTGHGIGLDVHEPPYLVAGNGTELVPGMTFSVEPGIYASGRWGMRIEDIVAVTEGGVERLNRSDRRLYRVE